MASRRLRTTADSWTDPATDRRRRVWALYRCWCCSRHLFVRRVFTKMPLVGGRRESPENAFAFSGGGRPLPEGSSLSHRSHIIDP